MHQLTHLANSLGTDKGTKHGNAHGYTVIYEQIFGPLRDRPINILEIGLSIGGPEQDKPATRKVLDVPSIRLWRSYFPLAQIYGLDISDCSAFELDRFTFFQVDCGDSAALKKVAQTGIVFDVIIDDGSHASFHQQLTLLELFPNLAPGGYYIIEDLDWQPTAYELELPRVPRTAELFSRFDDFGNANNGSEIDTARWQAVRDGVASVKSFSRKQIDESVPITLRKRWLRREIERILGIKRPDRQRANPIKLIVMQKERVSVTLASLNGTG